jgi:hypothetical protein
MNYEAHSFKLQRILFFSLLLQTKLKIFKAYSGLKVKVAEDSVHTGTCDCSSVSNFKAN